ncbi:MAG: nucleotidyltransferase [Clostridia bacterium]|nr:nucleotidyltransferase [Clostridia bacterium]
MITGIIAEYNIFHNGHKYQIDEVKKTSDAVVAVMSGSFVQRGDVAITDKWSRAKMALMCGADLVLELPTCYTLNAAPNFATGGVNTLNELGVVDSIEFGSESGNIDALLKAAELMKNESKEISEKIKKYVSDGMSYPSALSKAYGGIIDPSLLSEPNNILSIEYIRALIKSNSKIKPFTIERSGASHHDTQITENIASASKIRDMISNGENIDNLIPYNLSDIGCSLPYSASTLDSAVISKLRLASSDKLKNISEMAEGLENRLIQSAMEYDNIASLAEAAKSKRYTLSKIRRIIMNTLLDFTADIYKPQPDYIRVLGMNKTGMAVLKQAKEQCTVPIITKTADYKENSKQFALDVRATDISALCCPDKTKRIGGLDFKTSPVIL